MRRSRLKKINVLLTRERDIPLLHFLWRWKVSTTMALCKKFYSKANIETGYRRLLKLEKAGFIKCPVDPSGQKYLWSIDKKGFLAIKESLPVLKEDGFKSENLNHDSLVTAVHLGEYLINKPKNIAFITEQILRRVHEDSLPELVPHGHRPDGYWFVKNENELRRVALEVELNAKRNSDYELVDSFYRSEKIDQVLWVVPKDSLAQRIYKQLIRNSGGDFGPHSFISLNDFYKDGWKAKIYLGKDKGKTIDQLLHNDVTTSSSSVVMSHHLNFLKSPHKSKSYGLSLGV